METDCTTENPPPLPAGTRLLHIGPHKTGTTSVQAALFAARDTMAAHGVDFPAQPGTPWKRRSPRVPGPR